MSYDPHEVPVDRTDRDPAQPGGQGTQSRRPPEAHAGLRRGWRVGIGTLSVLAVGLGGFALGSHAGGTETRPPGPVVAAGAIDTLGGCDELLRELTRRGLERVGPNGWNSTHHGDIDEDRTFSSEGDGAATEQPTGSPSDATSEVTSSETGTNIQEAGVDEPDIAKTNGSVVVQVSDGMLKLTDVSGPRPLPTGSLRLGSDRPGEPAEWELLLRGTTVLVIGTGGWSGSSDWSRTRVATPTQSVVQSIDISDPHRPRLTHTSTYQARVLSSRLTGDTVRLVLSSGLPQLDFDGYHRRSGLFGRLSSSGHNKALVKGAALSDWLPTVSDDDRTAEQIVACSDVALPSDDIDLGMSTIVGFPISDPTERDSSALAATAHLAYQAGDRLFLAANTRRASGWSGSRATTTVYDFDLVDTRARFQAAATLKGRLEDRWSLDWADNTLRVALAQEHDNAVVLLRPEGDDLVEIGRVEELGIDEQIKAVRWFDRLAVVVTYRETDPVYTLDLTDPTRPELLGELKIPGFSEYLHPIGRDRLLGVGNQGGGLGAQASLFDLTDLRDPREVDVVHYPTSTVARAGRDPRAYTWLPEQDVAVTVIDHGAEVELSLLRPSDTSLTATPLRVPGTSGRGDVVRILPRGGGAVVVTSTSVALLDIDTATLVGGGTVTDPPVPPGGDAPIEPGIIE